MTLPTATHSLAPELEADADRALAILLDPELDAIVDMVLLSHGDHYEARTHDGSVRFRRTESGYEHLDSDGTDPLADQSTKKFAPLHDERAERVPPPIGERVPARLRHDRAAVRSPGRT